MRCCKSMRRASIAGFLQQIIDPTGVSSSYCRLHQCPVEGLPGLAAMEARGEELTSQKKLDLGTTELYALVADFSPVAGSRLAALTKKVGDAAVDIFFGEPNDIVVPTRGCFDLKDAKGFPVSHARIHQFADGKVNHINFFNSPQVRSTLADLMTAPM
jgi:hypothetical protein